MVELAAVDWFRLPLLVVLSIKGRVGPSLFEDSSFKSTDELDVMGYPADVGNLDEVVVVVVVVVVFDLNSAGTRVADSGFSPLMLVNKLSESLVTFLKVASGLSVMGYTELGIDTALGVFVVGLVVPSSSFLLSCREDS